MTEDKRMRMGLLRRYASHNDCGGVVGQMNLTST